LCGRDGRWSAASSGDDPGGEAGCHDHGRQREDETTAFEAPTRERDTQPCGTRARLAPDARARGSEDERDGPSPEPGVPARRAEADRARVGEAPREGGHAAGDERRLSPGGGR
jgi:hypothetical protein